MKVAVSGVLAIVLALASHGGASAQPRAPALRLTAGSATGTAVLVERAGRGELGPERQLWLLTAYHNIHRKRTVSIETRQGLSATLDDLTDDPVCVLQGLDVAAVRLNPSGAVWVARAADPAALRAELPNTDRGTYALGHPTLRALSQTLYPYNYRAEGSLGARMRIANQARIRSHALTAEAIESEILLINDFTITYGFSGGPLLAKGDPENVLVGIIQGGDPTPGKLAWATPADAIHAALDDGCTEVPYPFTAQTSWPPRGIRGAAYSDAGDVRLTISLDGYTPAPLRFVREEKTELTLRVRVEAAGGSEVLLDPQPGPGIEHLSDAGARTLEPGFHDFTYVFRIERGFEGDEVTLPFVLRTYDGRELERLELRGTVDDPDAFQASLDVGFDYEPDRKGKVFSALLGIAPELDAGPTRFALRAGFGLALMHVRRFGYAPTGQVLEESESWEPGARAQLLPELRLRPHAAIGWRFALGVFYELYGFESEGERDTCRFGFPLQGAVSIQTGAHALVLRVQVAYERWPGVDHEYSDFLAEPVSGRWSPSLGLGASYVFTTF